MSKRYPALTPRQICKILKERGFELTNKKGDHKIYEDDADPPHNVQVDNGEKNFGPAGMRIIIKNSGLTREEFYGSIKKIAKMAGVEYNRPGQSS